jgi:cob(I)alamin adenosyltransferase
MGKPSQEDIQMAQEALQKVIDMFDSYSSTVQIPDVIILDEIIVCVTLKIFDESVLLLLISKKPKNVELVLTGRGATPALIDAADLVSVINDEKHYFKKGVQARIGIEM